MMMEFFCETTVCLLRHGPEYHDISHNKRTEPIEWHAEYTHTVRFPYISTKATKHRKRHALYDMC